MVFRGDVFVGGCYNYPDPYLNSTTILFDKCFVIQYGSKLYIRDHGCLGFSAQKYRPKTSLSFPYQQFGNIG